MKASFFTILLTGLLFLFFSSGLKAQVFCDNRTSTNIILCIAYQHQLPGKSPMWVTEGWFNIPPGERLPVLPDMNKNTAEGGNRFDLHYYAFTPGNASVVWAGDMMLLVDGEVKDNPPHRPSFRVEEANNFDAYSGNEKLNVADFLRANAKHVGVHNIVLEGR